MERAEKNSEIEFLTSVFSKSQIALCADYRGLNVAEITTLRKKLRDNGAIGKVVKNTLAKISAKKALGENGEVTDPLQKFLDLFDGPSFLIYSDKDPITSAKIVQEFIKTKETFKVKGAWVDGAFVDTRGVDALAKMPSKEETLSMLLRLISTPATQMVRLLNAPASQLVQVIEAYRRKLEG